METMYGLYDTVVFENSDILNIARRYTISSKSINNNESIFQSYIIYGWESPETVAFKLYDSCDYEWAVLLANNIIDPYFGWLLQDNEVKMLIEKKYGEAKNNIMYYIKDDIIYNEPITGSQSVTFSEYEYLENEKKRTIKVIKPELIADVLSTFLKISAGEV